MGKAAVHFKPPILLRSVLSDVKVMVACGFTLLGSFTFWVGSVIIRE